MKKAVLILLGAGLIVYTAGCSKKQQSLEEMQQPMSPEDLSRLASAENKTVPEAKIESVTAVSAPAGAASEAKLENLPPSGPFKPSNQEVQTALKNAGFYTGTVDGKIGPRTKAAVEEFQKKNGLQVDGKVGPKTWSVLSAYLNPPAAASVKPKKRR